MMHGKAARTAFDANLRDTPVYVGLVTEPIGDDAIAVIEPTGASYARQVVEFEVATGTTGAATENITEVAFPVAVEDWGIATSFAIFDALTGGNLLYSGDIAAPISITPGITATFEIGALQLVV